MSTNAIYKHFGVWAVINREQRFSFGQQLDNGQLQEACLKFVGGDVTVDSARQIVTYRETDVFGKTTEKIRSLASVAFDFIAIHLQDAEGDKNGSCTRSAEYQQAFAAAMDKVYCTIHGDALRAYQRPEEETTVSYEVSLQDYLEMGNHEEARGIVQPLIAEGKEEICFKHCQPYQKLGRGIYKEIEITYKIADLKKLLYPDNAPEPALQ